MNALLSYLRSAGFRTLSGMITPTDFDHEEMLRHTYSKFGFKITDHQHRRALHLDLLDVPVPPLQKDGCLTCCRDSSYQMLRAEQMLKDSENLYCK